MRLAKGEGPPGSADPAELAALVKLVADGAISGTNAKEVFAEHFASGAAVAAHRRGARLPPDLGRRALGAAIEQVLAANPAAVADYRAGKGAASASSSARS
jgi:aspartyl-tRNA(Asn)/glutamyl-tRNA(Gln) amidotransferase subunit B